MAHTNEYIRAWNAKHPGNSAARSAKHYEKNSASTLAKQAVYREENRITIRAKSIARYAENIESERARNSARRKTHPEKECAKVMARRAVKMQQICRCCTKIQIEELYGAANLVGGEVDHKIPLALGGHHCVKNLQAMTYEDHREKTKSDVRYIAEARRRSKLLLQWPTAAAA
jgi:5-methylcytosine-specific restriction endonuclease McrA